jgi:hypothetical protein
VLGCPRNNQFFFQFEPKQTKTQSVLVVFRFIAKPNKIFSVCFGDSFRYLNNRNKPKKSPKNQSLLGCPRTINFFLVRTETNRNSTCFGCFLVCFFHETKQNFFWFVSVFRTGIETTETNRTMVWGIKKVDILTNLLFFRLVFCLFRLFRNTETPCFDIKAKQQKQTSCFG